MANISHEFRTPLNGVIGVADLLNDGSLSLSQKDKVDTIESPGKHLFGIINDVLNFSKIDSQGIELANDPFDLTKEIDACMRIFKYRAKTRKVDFYFDNRADEATWVNGDSIRLRQVFMNLVGNAVKFSDAKGEVRVRLDQVGEGGIIGLASS